MGNSKKTLVSYQWTILKIFLLLVPFGITGGCALPGPSFGFASWQEEILLHDGQLVIADRQQSYGRKITLDSREGAVLSERWAFPIPGTPHKIVWRANFKTVPEGEQLMVLLYGYVNGRAYIATSPAGCISYNHWGRPNPPYVFFRYETEQWKRIYVGEFPVELNQINVMVGLPDKKNRSGLISVQRITENNRDLQSPHKAILREPFERAGAWCPDFNSERYTSPKAPKKIQ